MKIVLVKNTTKLDDTPPPIYKNEGISSYKYYKQHDNTHMGAVINNRTVTDIHMCPLDYFQHIASCHTVRSDQHLPMNVFNSIQETNYAKAPTIRNHILS